MSNEVDEIFSAVTQHQVDNPDHGYNCPCMDEYIRKMRSILHAYFDLSDIRDSPENETLYKSIKRWVVVVKLALRDIA